MAIGSVAVIGAGSMGAAAARHLQAAGYRLSVCDVDEAVLLHFRARGAHAVRSAADCAEADLVIVLVATATQLQHVLLGPDGLASGLRPGHAPLVAVMSTVPTAAIEQLRIGLGDRIAGLCDAPISGGPSRAERGTLTVLAGGSADVLDAMEPVFRSFASTIVRCGGLGSGQAMKIVNNVVGNANVVVTAEAYRLACELGLDLEATARALDQGTGRNFYSASPADLRATYAALVPDRRGFDSLLGIVRKDITHAAELTAATPGRYPMIAGLKALIDALGDETYDNWRYVGTPAARPSSPEEHA